MSLIVALGCCVGRRSTFYSRLTVQHSSAGSRYLRWIGAVWTRHRMDFYLLRFYVYRVWINSDDDSVRHRNSSWRKQFFIVLEIRELEKSLRVWPRSKIVYETAFEEGPTERIAHGLLRGGSHLSKFFFAQLALTTIGSISEYSRRNGSAWGELLGHWLLITAYCCWTAANQSD